MKFKVIEGTPTHNKMRELWKKIIEANTAAKDLALSVGAKQWIAGTGFYQIAGGLSGFRLPEQPKGWKKVFVGTHENIYFPSSHLKANKEIIEKINNLPSVTTDELNAIVGYEEEEFNTPRGCVHCPCPSLSFKEESFLLSVREESAYKGIPGEIVEITVSEYNELKGEQQS